MMLSSSPEELIRQRHSVFLLFSVLGSFLSFSLMAPTACCDDVWVWWGKEVHTLDRLPRGGGSVLEPLRTGRTFPCVERVSLYWQREQHENTREWQIVQYGCGVKKWEIENEAKEIGGARSLRTLCVLLAIILWMNLNFLLWMIDSHWKVLHMNFWHKLVRDVAKFSFCSDCVGTGMGSDSEADQSRGR